jgi:hypothetical protein
MLTGLDILLARMKTNPEEFLIDGRVPYQGEVFGGKWSDLLDYAWRIADESEREALEAARKEFYRDDFNERVMKRLAGEEVQEEKIPPYIIKGSSVDAAQNVAQNAMTHQQMMQQQMMQNAALQGGKYSGGFLGLGNLLGSTER